MSGDQIGSRLIWTSPVTSTQLNAALERQRIEGGPVGRHLVISGALTRRELYQALADQWGVPLVDLVAEPPSPGLLNRSDLVSADEGWLPWRRDGDTLVIATSRRPTAELLATAGHRYRSPVRAVATTDWDVAHAVQATLGKDLAHEAAERFATERPDLSAKPGLTRWQYVPVLAAAALLAAGLLLDARSTALVVFVLANLAFTAQAALRVTAALLSWHPHRSNPPDRIPDDDLPTYTILVPAFREANIVDHVIDNIGALDYPTSKLDVILLLESNDAETIAAAKAAHPPEYVRIVVVPPGEPQTKPRACNYGLTFARGAYVVVFDAGDRPDPDQLRRAVAAFRAEESDQVAGRHSGRPLACVQASLNFFNADHDVLTRLSAVEHAHWFDAMLPGMDRMRIPIPLSGTSNHFDITALVQAGAWDPYNVTEGADLGLRIDAAGYRVATIDSVTWEEATSRLRPWIHQRTRWITGYMMTASVNLRRPVSWLRHARGRGIVTMVGLVLSTPLTLLTYPFALALALLAVMSPHSPMGELDHGLWVAGSVNLLVATAALVVISAVAAWHRYSWGIAVFALLSPLYWLAHTTAAWRAAWQLLASPRRRKKTSHGLAEEPADSTVDA